MNLLEKLKEKIIKGEHIKIAECIEKKEEREKKKQESKNDKVD